ncbi:MAG: 3,4-dihydroxy-2-butanone-4-phosphate synthase [Phycisphaerales bacterium]|nr:3,4-dihydroxy-2-butanone-4-phosphate synthase [Phycisphaerales bacterium]
MFDTIEDALESLKQGKIVIICDDENRENEGDFVALGESCTPSIINFMVTEGRGLVCAPITKEIALQIGVSKMVSVNTDIHQTAFTTSIDHISNGTGISAVERSITIKKLTDMRLKSTDFRKPGHIFPLVARPNGVLERAGHTEAAIDLAQLCGRKPVGVICEIMNSDGTMAHRDELIDIAKKWQLKIITIKDLIEYRKKHEKLIRKEVSIQLPTKHGNFQCIGFSSAVDGKEHIALVKGKVQNLQVPVLTRVHSECLTGDVFQSLRCDCHAQLEYAFQLIQKQQQGIFILLRQEGRGIGLINKLKAYALQDTHGLNTIDANLKLGFECDLREYYIAAHILHSLGVQTIELITNNPEKINTLQNLGITVSKRIDASVPVNTYNHKYIFTKLNKLKHYYDIHKKNTIHEDL